MMQKLHRDGGCVEEHEHKPFECLLKDEVQTDNGAKEMLKEYLGLYNAVVDSIQAIKDYDDEVYAPILATAPEVLNQLSEGLFDLCRTVGDIPEEMTYDDEECQEPILWDTVDFDKKPIPN